MKPFIIGRIFDAPRQLVWDAFTKPEHLQRWWGPKGTTVLRSAMDFRPGGSYHYGMRLPDGTASWGLQRYREIVSPSRLVFVNSFSDESGGLARHPLSDAWPIEMLSTLTFEEVRKDRTKLTIQWEPINASAPEVQTFLDGFGSMTNGWSGSFEVLEQYLREVHS